MVYAEQTTSLRTELDGDTVLDKAREQGKGRGRQLEVAYCIVCPIISSCKSS